MDKIEQSAFFDQFHCQAESGRLGNGSYHEHDVGMTILGQHVDLVVDLIKELIADVGVEDLLYSHLELEILSYVDRTETAHRDLFSDLEVIHTES